MRLKDVLLYIAIIIVGLWLVGSLLRFAVDLLNPVLTVGAVLLILWLTQTYALNRKK